MITGGSTSSRIARHSARENAIEPDRFGAAVTALADFAKTYHDDEFGVHKVALSFDEGRDGEPVTHVLLLLSDPSGETWDVDRIRELRLALGRNATELGLPPVTLTLVAESEVEAEEAFAQ